MKTDLRKSALGGLDGNRRNSFRKTSFERCDFRQTAYVSAEFEQCVFEHCKLDKVDFQGSTFVDCTFIGELSEVLFYRSAHNAEHLPANEMHDVDFSRARLRLVEFRGLDLKKVAWPQDAEHIITDDYAAVLECMIGVVEKRSDAAARQLTALLKLRQKWAGSGQARSVFNRQDFEDLGGTSLLEAFETVLGMCQRGGGAAVHRTFPGHK